MKDIVDGLFKFQSVAFPKWVELFKQLSHGQSPSTLFITSSENRVVMESLTQREADDLFVIRNAGNIVPFYGPEHL